MLIRNLLSNLRAKFLRPGGNLAAVSAAPMPAQPRIEEQAPVPTESRSAVAILDRNPDLTAAELAEKAGVTLSYARSLVRRRQAKRSIALTRAISPDTGLQSLQSQVRELARRVEMTDGRALSSASAPVSYRTQVLDRSAAGVAIEVIAEELGIATGEAEFILKIDRMKKSSKN